MAEVNESSVSTCDNSTHCSNSQIVNNCANCVLKDQQLQLALTELESAQTIISILQEDIKHRSASFTQQANQDSKTRGNSQGNQKWETVLYNNMRSKKFCNPEVKKRHISASYDTANRYALLYNLKDTEEDIMCMDNHARTSLPPTKPPIQQRMGSSIPTIVNGTVNHKLGSKTTKKVCNNQAVTVRSIEHKVKIIGDSHLKGSATRINQYLNTKYQLTSFIKPGANMNHLIQTQDKELKSLGKKDAIIISGGSNDMDNSNGEVNGILKMMHNFIVKYSNTNILIVNLPPRYDQPVTLKSKFDTQAFNQKLNNIVKRFSHVSVAEMCSERRFYTSHGLHMNHQGKEMFAKRTASKIKKLFEQPNKPKLIIPLPSKEDLLTLSQTLSNDITVNEQSIVKETVESPDLENIVPSKPTPVSNDTHLRSSTRNKKVPCTMTTDFLWYKQPILGH